MLKVLIALLLGSTTLLFGETYEQWAHAAAKTTPLKLNTASVVEPAYLGNLDLSFLPSDDFPIQVNFSYRENPYTEAQEENKANRQLQKLLFVRTEEIARPDQAQAISVWVPDVKDNVSDFGNGYHTYVEVLTQNHLCLYRQELETAEKKSSYSYNSNQHSNEVIIVPREGAAPQFAVSPWIDSLAWLSLPKDPDILEAVAALGLSDPLLKTSSYTDLQWRRILLSGTRVVGPTPLVNQLAQRLNLPVNAPIYFGGIFTFEAANIQDINLTRNVPTSSNLDRTEQPNPFSWSTLPSDKKVYGLAYFTLYFLINYLVFQIVVTWAGFRFFRGPRMIYRWFLLPLGAVIYSIGGFIVAPLVLDFSPTFHIYNQVLCVQGWPEARVETVISYLHFTNGQLHYLTPPGTELIKNRDNFVRDTLIEHVTEQGNLFDIPVRYGSKNALGFKSWIKNIIHFQVTSTGEITSAQDWSNVWILQGDQWRDLGPLKAGVVALIKDSKVVPITASDGEANPWTLWPAYNDYPYGNDTYPLLPLMTQLRLHNHVAQNQGVGYIIALNHEPVLGTLTGLAAGDKTTQSVYFYQYPTGVQP